MGSGWPGAPWWPPPSPSRLSWVLRVPLGQPGGEKGKAHPSSHPSLASAGGGQGGPHRPQVRPTGWWGQQAETRGWAGDGCGAIGQPLGGGGWWSRRMVPAGTVEQAATSRSGVQGSQRRLVPGPGGDPGRAQPGEEDGAPGQPGHGRPDQGRSLSSSTLPAARRWTQRAGSRGGGQEPGSIVMVGRTRTCAGRKRATGRRGPSEATLSS